MAEANATPPASAEIDYAKLAAAMAPLIGSAVADAVKPINEQLGKLQAPAAPAAAATGATGKNAPETLTIDQITKLLDDRDAKRQQTDQVRAARDAFAAEKMKDLPGIYQQQLPQTANPAELAAAEQRIRNQYQADFKATGGKAPNVAGTPPAGTAPAGAAVDLSKLTPEQLIQMDLQKKPLPAASLAAAGAAQ